MISTTTLILFILSTVTVSDTTSVGYGNKILDYCKVQKLVTKLQSRSGHLPLNESMTMTHCESVRPTGKYNLQSTSLYCTNNSGEKNIRVPMASQLLQYRSQIIVITTKIPGFSSKFVVISFQTHFTQGLTGAIDYDIIVNLFQFCI